MGGIGGRSRVCVQRAGFAVEDAAVTAAPAAAASANVQLHAQ